MGVRAQYYYGAGFEVLDLLLRKCCCIQSGSHPHKSSNTGPWDSSGKIGLSIECSSQLLQHGILPRMCCTDFQTGILCSAAPGRSSRPELLSECSSPKNTCPCIKRRFIPTDWHLPSSSSVSSPLSSR